MQTHNKIYQPFIIDLISERNLKNLQFQCTQVSIKFLISVEYMRIYIWLIFQGELQQTQNANQNQMDDISQSYQQDDRQNKSIEDSEDRPDSKILKTIPRTRIIRKQHKSKTKIKEPAQTMVSDDSKSFSLTTPFGICESELQKSQRIEHYLKHDIENFYKLHINEQDIEQLESFLLGNYLDLKYVIHRDLEQVWPGLLPSISQVWSYLQMVDMAQKSANKFVMVFEQDQDRRFCCFYFKNCFKILEISSFQQTLIQSRQQFLNLFRKLQTDYRNNGKNHQNKYASQIKTQIIYLYKKLCQSTLLLQKKFTQIKQNINLIQTQQASQVLNEAIEDRYQTAILKKLVNITLSNQPIDYLNFYKNNEIIEQGYPPEASKINDQKDFEDFMKKKKNRKGKKARFALHSGCLGCLNCFHEIYNPFFYCQECYIRFHRFCYPGYVITDQNTQKKEMFCENCYNKKNNLPLRSKFPQCDLCTVKGLLSFNVSNSRKVHIFCGLIHGLWTVYNQVLFFDEEKERNHELYGKISKCQLCQQSSSFVHCCLNCQKKAHASCAFLSGWDISVQFLQSSTETNLSMRCCGQNLDLGENERRRKFINNYKKYGYLGI